MSCEELYNELILRGVNFSIKGENLVFSAAKGVLTPNLISQMRQNKQGLLDCVRAASSESTERTNEADTVIAFPASLGQEALWLIHQSDPNSAAYNTAASLRIHSPVNIDALRTALISLIMRHELLRTTFKQIDTNLHAQISQRSQPDFSVIEVYDCNEGQIAERIKKEYETPFDLETGPLFRTRLFSLSPEHHIILLTLHHIVFDASSLWVLQNELQQLYQAEVEGSTCLLPSLRANYRDFAHWQRQFPDTDEGNTQWKFWETQLKGDPPPGELLWSNKRVCGIHRSCATMTRPLMESTAKAVRAVAKDLGTTPFCVAMAAFQTLVHRCGGQDDFVIGTSTSGRTRPEFAHGIGYFVNILPIRSRITNSMSFNDLVDQTKKTVLEAIRAGELPFSTIVDRLNPLRVSGAAPLCRMVFGWQKSHAFSNVAHLLDADNQTVNWGGLNVRAYPIAQQEGQFDLTMELHEGSKSLGCVLKYDRNLLTDEAAGRMLDRYLQLLGKVLEEPQSLIRDLDLCTPAESIKIKLWSSGTELPAPTRLRFDDVWSDSVQLHPQSVAFQYEDQTLRYCELDALADEVANRYLQCGIEPGDRIVLCTNRGPHIPICILAALKCGATHIPVAADSPPDRLRRILDECQPKLVITNEDRVALTRSLVIANATVWSTNNLGFYNNKLPNKIECTNYQSTWKRIEFPDTTPAYIIYTSGSTGMPKGVTVNHRAICHHVVSVAQIYALTDQDRVLQFCDLTFDPSIEQFLTPWSVGASVVMRDDRLFSASGFWKRVKQQGITVANLPPNFMVECVRSAEHSSPLRLLIVGGDVFPLQGLGDWLKNHVRTLNAYGPTEAVITATTYEVSDIAILQQDSVPIGKPKPGSFSYIIDRQGKLCPIGVAGELYLGGPMLADGYVNGTPSDNARFTQDPFIGGEARMYRTGDWAKWNDRGELVFLGRADRQIKVRGFRVELGEIEQAMLSIKGIEQAAVRTNRSVSEQFLVGYYSLTHGTEISQNTIVSRLKTILPNYMIPDRFMEIDQWPLKLSGKIDLERLPIPEKRCHVALTTPPENELQRLIAQSWCEVLELNSVGIDDDFLEIGGGSLQSLRILTKLGESGIGMKDNQTDLTPQLLFQYTTIRELSSLLVLHGTASNDTD